MDSSPIYAMVFVTYMINHTQYSQLVMTSRKAEMETLGSSVSKGRAESAIVGANTDLAEAKASSKPSYEAIANSLFDVCCSQPGQPRTDQNQWTSGVQTQWKQ